MSDNNQSKLKAVEEAMQAMRADYIAALPDKLHEIERKILEIPDSEQPLENINELFRDVHSLKGTSATFDLPIIATICHQLEDHLEQFSDKSVEISLKFIDLMQRATEIIERSVSPDYSEIEKALYTFQKTIADNQLLGVIIDPSRANTLLAKRILEQYPVKLTAINDGLAALTRLLFVKYDFILLSRELPSISGPGLIAALQATNCPNRDTQTIIISSSNSKIDPLNESIIHPVKRDQNFVSALPQVLEQVFPEISV